MTNLPTQEQIENLQIELAELEHEQDTLTNKNGNKVKWTETKQEKLDKLKEKIFDLKNDKLPTGAITALEKEYLRVKYGRQRIFTSKEIEKGIRVEKDSIRLLKKVDNKIYFQNDEYFENDYIVGTPDIIAENVLDIKSSYDIVSFNNAELTTDYEWQLKAYTYLLQSLDIEVGNTPTLCYCLTNFKIEQIISAKKSLYFNYGYSEEDIHDEYFLEELKNTELNMIFDFEEFKATYPGYDLDTPIDERQSIPKAKRVKKYQIQYTPFDKAHIERRVKLAREWLQNRHLQSEIENII